MKSLIFVMSLISIFFSTAAHAWTAEEANKKIFDAINKELEGKQTNYGNIQIKDFVTTKVLAQIQNEEGVQTMYIEGNFVHQYEDFYGNTHERTFTLKTTIKTVSDGERDDFTVEVNRNDFKTDQEVLKLVDHRGQALLSLKGSSPTTSERMIKLINAADESYTQCKRVALDKALGLGQKLDSVQKDFQEGAWNVLSWAGNHIDNLQKKTAEMCFNGLCSVAKFCEDAIDTVTELPDTFSNEKVDKKLGEWIIATHEYFNSKKTTAEQDNVNVKPRDRSSDHDNPQQNRASHSPYVRQE